MEVAFSCEADRPHPQAANARTSNVSPRSSCRVKTAISNAHEIASAFSCLLILLSVGELVSTDKELLSRRTL